MSIINIPNKSPGDQLTSTEFNEVVAAIKAVQESTGWGQYSDDEFTDIAPQSILGNGTYHDLENNAAAKIETYLPYVSDVQFPLYNGDTIRVPQVGSAFNGYIRFTAKVDTVEGLFNLGIDIGGGAGVIFVNTLRFSRGQNIYHEYTIPINGYMLDTFLTNGGRVVVAPETGDTMDVYGAVFYIEISYREP